MLGSTPIEYINIINQSKESIFSHLTELKLAFLIKLVTEEKFEDKKQACNESSENYIRTVEPPIRWSRLPKIEPK